MDTTFVQQTNSREELNNCNFVKTVLMVSVVISHCTVYWRGDWFTADPVLDSRLLAMVAEWLNSFHIYTFTLVSGYIFYHLRCERNRYPKFTAFVNNKARRLLVPYISAAVFWVIPIQCYFFQYYTTDILKNFALGISPNQLWFLLMLFGVFVIFWPLSSFFREHTAGGGLLVFALYGIAQMFQGKVPNVFMIWRIFGYISLFWIGFKLRQFDRRIIRKVPTVVLLTAHAFIFVTSQLLLGYSGKFYMLLKMGVDLCLHVVGSLSAFELLLRVANRIRWDTSWFRWLSARSMVVYLIHQQLIYFVIYALNGLIVPELHAVINFVFCFICSLAIASILLRFKVTRFLVGE